MAEVGSSSQMGFYVCPIHRGSIPTAAIVFLATPSTVARSGLLHRLAECPCLVHRYSNVLYLSQILRVSIEFQIVSRLCLPACWSHHASMWSLLSRPCSEGSEAWVRKACSHKTKKDKRHVLCECMSLHVMNQLALSLLFFFKWGSWFEGSGWSMTDETGTPTKQCKLKEKKERRFGSAAGALFTVKPIILEGFSIWRKQNLFSGHF